MNSDAAFTIGTTHTVCQDYAAAKTSSAEQHMVGLADGCSSSPNSDIGARLLTQAALSILPTDDLGMELFERALHQSAACGDLLGISRLCLDATLLVIQASRERFTIACYGDGVLAMGRRNGGLELFSVGFESGYPDYPSYQLSPNRARQWAVQDGGSKTLAHWIGPGEGEMVAINENVVSLSGRCADYQFAAVLSDGIHSVAQVMPTETGQTSRPVPVWEAASRLLAFKSGTGQFAQRRMAAFGRECQTQHWQHSDDLALGAVWFGE